MYSNLKLFDDWYQHHYENLKRQAFVRSSRDEDSFHDAYLSLHKVVMFLDKEIPDYTPFFIVAYRSARKKAKFREGRYVHPEEYFFQTTSVTDDSEEDIRMKVMQEKAYARILSLIKKNYKEEYRLFYLKMIDPCCSYRELQLYTGISVNVLRRKIIEIKEYIKKEIENETYDL